MEMNNHMTAAEKIEAEVKRYEAILARRGQFYEDEGAAYLAFKSASDWLREDKEEADRIELEAAEAEETERTRDPNAPTKDLFATYRKKLKQEGRMR